MTLPVDCCIYVWRWSLCASKLDVTWLVVASMFDVIACALVQLVVLIDLLLSLPLHNAKWKTMVLLLLLLSSLSPLRNAMWKMMALLPFLLLLLPSQDARNKTACAPLSCDTTLKWQALAHEALLSSLLCDATYKCRTLVHKALLLLPLWNTMLKCCALAHEALLLLPLCDATCKHTALAWWMVATQTIFLWHCRCRFHIRLTRQTLRQQQCEVAFAHLWYKQDCCLRLALA